MRLTREAVWTDEAPSFSRGIVRQFALILAGIGEAGFLIAEMILQFPAQFTSGRRFRELLRQLYTAGIKTLPVITVVGMFTGMVLALQIGLELRRYNQEIYIGAGVMVSLLREIGPFMTGLILAACVGSSMAAQIASMKVNEEIAALEIMSISPVRFLMAPRMAAMMLITPLLSFYSCVLGVIGGGIVGETQLNVPFRQYMQNAMGQADNFDLWVGIFKAFMFGIVITGVACYEGIASSQGAVGVGQATRSSVIKSFLLILIIGYMITRMFYDL